MSDAQLHRSDTAPRPNGGKTRGGGQLSRQFPIKLTGYIDEDLQAAITRAAAAERERAFVIVRRWLRFAARQSGYYEESGNGR
jgi:hypothetical protein